MDLRPVRRAGGTERQQGCVQGRAPLGPGRQPEPAGRGERPASGPSEKADHGGRGTGPQLAALPRPGAEPGGLPGEAPRHGASSRVSAEGAKADPADPRVAGGPPAGEAAPGGGEEGAAAAGGRMTWPGEPRGVSPRV